MSITLGALNRLRGEIAFKMVVIEELQKTITKFTGKVNQDNPQEEFVTTIAANMMRFYTGMEDILEQILRVFDDFQPQGESWHQSLLIASLNTTKHRPAILCRATFNVLNDLRGFRHVVQKAYTQPFDWGKMKHLAESAKEMLQAFSEDLKDFDAFLERAIDALDRS